MEEKLQAIWNNKVLRYGFVLVGAAIADFLISLYTYSIAHGWIFVQGIVGFLLPFVNFAFSIWFIEAKENSERFWLTFYSAIGMVIGSTLMLLLIK